MNKIRILSKCKKGGGYPKGISRTFDLDDAEQKILANKKLEHFRQLSEGHEFEVTVLHEDGSITEDPGKFE